MQTFKYLIGAVVGIVLGIVVLGPDASFAQSPPQQTPEQLLATEQVAAPQTARQQVQQLADTMDFAGAEAAMKRAHLQALAGRISQNDLREIFILFRSTSPDVRQFADQWVGEMPDSPYALTALAINNLAASGDMRGTEPAIFVYPEASGQAADLVMRSKLLALRAYQIAPDLVAASDTLLAANLVNAGPLGKIGAQTRILDRVMQLIPNRSTLISALVVTQPAWGGEFQDAIELCVKYARFVTDTEGYTAETCMVEAAYTYRYSSAVRTSARAILRDSDAEFLDFARRKDWQPAVSDAMDQKIIDYLQGEGSADFDLAERFHRSFFNPPRPDLFETVYLNQRRQAFEDLKTDPFNPDLIRIISNSVLLDLPADGPADLQEIVALAKLALRAAPYDPKVWYNIASILSKRNDPLDAAENAFFQNSVYYSNHSDKFFFAYLSAKRADYQKIQRRIREGAFSEPELTSADEAVICPLIQLIRISKTYCGMDWDGGSIAADDYRCAPDPDPESPDNKMIASAIARQACTAEINSELLDLYFLAPADTDVVMPVEQFPGMGR